MSVHHYYVHQDESRSSEKTTNSKRKRFDSNFDAQSKREKIMVDLELSHAERLFTVVTSIPEVKELSSANCI